MKDRIVELVRVKAGDLVDHPANWRRHPRRQSQALRAMLNEVGFATALVARRDGDKLVLIDGHLRKQVSADEIVPVLVVDVNEAEAATLLATLDPLSSLARPDPEALDALLARVTVSDEAVADLLEELARSAGLPFAQSGADPDLIPDEPETRTSPGDLFALGDHRLLCGDARRTDGVARLMAGEQANLLLTDPPYGVGYQGRTKRALTIEGDRAGGLAELLSSSFKACHEVLTPGAAIYVFSPSGPGQHVFLDAFIAQGWRLRQVLVWAKDVPVLSHSDYLFEQLHARCLRAH